MRIIKRAVGVVLVVVLVAVLAVTGLLVWVTARALPADERDGHGPGSLGGRHRRSRRDRHRPHHRRRRSTTCSSPRATSTPASGCGRWRSGATSRPGGSRSCSGRASSTPTSSSGRSAGGSPRSATSTRWGRRHGPSSTPTPKASTPGSMATAGRSGWPSSRQGSRPSRGRTSTPSRGARSRPGTSAATSTRRSSATSPTRQLGDPARTDELFPPYREDAPVITPTGLPGSGGAGADAGRGAGTATPRTATAATPRADRPGRGGRLALDRRSRPGAPPDRRTRHTPTGSPRTTASARTTGSSAPRCR